MARLHIFADESGDFEFSRKPNVSRYFMLCTVTMSSCDVGVALLDLRRQLAWDGFELGEYFHASTDKQPVRDRVFDLITNYDFSLQATIMEKSKAQTQVRTSRARFYQHGWLYHFRYGIPPLLNRLPELLVTAASIGTKKERTAFTIAINDVMSQTVAIDWKTDFCPASADPCLQVADYCAWAMHRKWERGDLRSYELIGDRVTYEFDLWKHGDTHHY